MACKEDTQVNRISGQLFNDCSTSQAFAEVALKSNVGNDFNDPIILGSGLTDANGNFSFTYELEEDKIGRGNLLYIAERGFETILENIQLNRDIVATMYRQNFAQVTIKLEGSRMFASQDTLFYGINSNSKEAFRVQPSPSFLDTFFIQVPNRIDRGSPLTFYYGVGKAAFDISREALSISDSVFQHISLTLAGCNRKDTVTMVIN